MPTRLALLACFALLAPTAAPPARAAAAPFPLKTPVTLPAAGGATIQTPAWKPSRPATADTAVFEHVGAPGEPVFVLVATIEEGPGAPVDWAAVRDNMAAEAAKADATLTLEVAGPFRGALGWSGQRMKGTLKSGGATLQVAVVSLVRQGRLLTISVLSSKDSPLAAPLAERVAATAKAEAP